MSWTSQRVFDALLPFGELGVSGIQVAIVAGLTELQLENTVRVLRRRGYVAADDNGNLRLTPAGFTAHAEGQRITSGPVGAQSGHRLYGNGGTRQKLWNALRLGKKLTADELLLMAGCDEPERHRDNAGKYLRALARAGYVNRLAMREGKQHSTSNGAIRWLLVSDTGPRAPQWNVSKSQIYDPNLDRCIDMDEDLAPVSKRSAT